MIHHCSNFALENQKSIAITVTIEELNRIFVKAHLRLIVGSFIGQMFAHHYGIECQMTFGIFIGLLFSVHLYKKGMTVLIKEYKRLKSLKENNNENIS